MAPPAIYVDTLIWSFTSLSPGQGVPFGDADLWKYSETTPPNNLTEHFSVRIFAINRTTNSSQNTSTVLSKKSALATSCSLVALKRLCQVATNCQQRYPNRGHEIKKGCGFFLKRTDSIFLYKTDERRLLIRRCIETTEPHLGP